jgi:hypothetical protein
VRNIDDAQRGRKGGIDMGKDKRMTLREIAQRRKELRLGADMAIIEAERMESEAAGLRRRAESARAQADELDVVAGRGKW